MHLDCFEVSCRVLEISAIEISALTEQDEPVSPDNPPYHDIVPPKTAICNIIITRQACNGLRFLNIPWLAIFACFKPAANTTLPLQP